jgi:thymidylate synthase (FAD)
MNEIKVLDRGFIRLVDKMGDDRAVAAAARVSYLSEAKTPEDDRRLIAYLWTHKHTTPFEHTAFKFHVKAPIFVARQWFRHRMASYNETSFRYREAPPEFYLPETWRAQDNKNKQGSVAAALEHSRMTSILNNQCLASMDAYAILLRAGASKELARLVLPVNLYTEFYWTLNAHALMHFLRLRCERHAQWEIRQYANAAWVLWAKIMPWTAEAFVRALDAQAYQATDGLPGPNLAMIPGVLREAADAI